MGFPTKVADGGDDSAENCIPLCLDCHADVESYNAHHPKGRKYTEKELKGHRDKCYASNAIVTDIHNDDCILEGTYARNLFNKENSNEKVGWGYSEQDKLVPLDLGMIVMVAGCTESRKSMYVQHIVNHNIRKGQKIVYCCLKEDVKNIGSDIIAEVAHLNPDSIKRGELTKNNWEDICTALENTNYENLKLFSSEELIGKEDRIISLVQNSNAEIIVIDDFNGLFLENDSDVDKFMYRLRTAATNSRTTVFIIYNIGIDKKRLDKRPMLDDFPSENYYRHCDIIQFLFRPSMHYTDDFIEEYKLEVINVKGIATGVYTFEMKLLDNVAGIFPYEVNI